jgi:hypothetical protein
MADAFFETEGRPNSEIQRKLKLVPFGDDHVSLRVLNLPGLLWADINLPRDEQLALAKALIDGPPSTDPNRPLAVGQMVLTNCEHVFEIIHVDEDRWYAVLEDRFDECAPRCWSMEETLECRNRYDVERPFGHETP